MKTRTIAGLILVAAAGAGASRAEEVGRFSIVMNDVTSLKPGAAASVPAKVGSPISLDEREATGEASGAQMMFGDSSMVSLGARTSFAVTRQVVDEATGQTGSVLDLLAGKVRVFVSRFAGEKKEVRVTTPTAVVGIKGSEAVIEILDERTTRVTFLAGTGRVRPRRSAGAWRDLAAGDQVTIRDGEIEVPIPVSFTPAFADGLIADTRPLPDPWTWQPRGRPQGQYALPRGTASPWLTKSGSAAAVAAPASGGPGFLPPGPGVLPGPVIPCVRNPQTGLGCP